MGRDCFQPNSVNVDITKRFLEIFINNCRSSNDKLPKKVNFINMAPHFHIVVSSRGNALFLLHGLPVSPNASKHYFITHLHLNFQRLGKYVAYITPRALN